MISVFILLEKRSSAVSLLLGILENSATSAGNLMHSSYSPSMFFSYMHVIKFITEVQYIF